MKLKYKDQLNKMQEERNKEIVKLREKKMTLKNIGDKFGISDEAVRKVLRKEKEAKTNLVDNAKE